MTVCGAALFALEPTEKPKGLISIGGGLILAPSFQTTKFVEDFGGGESKSSGFGGGVNLFLDAKYVEVNLGLLFANEKDEDADKGYDSTNFMLGLLLKYPIALNSKTAIFPFAGFDYRIALSGKYEGEDWPDDPPVGDSFNALSVLFGVGFDYDITSKLYFRGEVGFGITFNTKNEDDSKEYIDSNFKGKIPKKLAIGYRL
jgi:hypothetical protein